MFVNAPSVFHETSLITDSFIKYETVVNKFECVEVIKHLSASLKPT